MTAPRFEMAGGACITSDKHEGCIAHTHGHWGPRITSLLNIVSDHSTDTVVEMWRRGWTLQPTAAESTRPLAIVSGAEAVGRVIREAAEAMVEELPQFIPSGRAYYCVSCEGYHNGRSGVCPKCDRGTSSVLAEYRERAS